MARKKFGDVVEFTVDRGFAYAIYTHEDKMYGSLLRVYNTIYPGRPRDFTSVICGHPSFSCFTPLGAGISQKLVTIVANVPIPPELQPFPLFRDGSHMDGKVKNGAHWRLWDGERSWFIGHLTPEQLKLPSKALWTWGLIIPRIERGFTDDQDPQS